MAITFQLPKIERNFQQQNTGQETKDAVSVFSGMAERASSVESNKVLNNIRMADLGMKAATFASEANTRALKAQQAMDALVIQNDIKEGYAQAQHFANTVGNENDILENSVYDIFPNATRGQAEGFNQYKEQVSKSIRAQEILKTQEAIANKNIALTQRSQQLDLSAAELYQDSGGDWSQADEETKATYRAQAAQKVKDLEAQATTKITYSPTGSVQKIEKQAVTKSGDDTLDKLLKTQKLEKGATEEDRKKQEKLQNAEIEYKKAQAAMGAYENGLAPEINSLDPDYKKAKAKLNAAKAAYDTLKGSPVQDASVEQPVPGGKIKVKTKDGQIKQIDRDKYEKSKDGYERLGIVPVADNAISEPSPEPSPEPPPPIAVADNDATPISEIQKQAEDEFTTRWKKGKLAQWFARKQLPMSAINDIREEEKNADDPFQFIEWKANKYGVASLTNDELKVLRYNSEEHNTSYVAQK